MSLAEILNSGNDCFEMHDIRSISESVVRNVTLNSLDRSEGSDEEVPLPGFEERRRCIDVTMRLILEEKELEFAAPKCLRRLRGNVNRGERLRARQTTVDSFFS